MARDLEADLKLCEEYLRNIRYVSHYSERWREYAQFVIAAREGWPETIRELTEARKRIAELETVIERYRISMMRARKTVEQLEDVLDE